MQPDTPYTNRELDQIHTSIFEALGRIEAQTTHTNGKVRFLEKMIYLAMGGLSVLTFFFAQDRLLLASEQPTTKEEVRKALIELQAEAAKLEIDAQQVAEPVVQ